MDVGVKWDRVCSEKELKETKIKCFTMPSTNRHVMLIKVRGKVYCIDQACYHHGGPLANGDIEELGGKLTVKCPWHSYQIALETGEGLYMGFSTNSGAASMSKSKPILKSKGPKQRVHPVEIRDHAIYVADSSKFQNQSTIEWESDTYAYQEQQVPEKYTGKVKLHSDRNCLIG